MLFLMFWGYKLGGPNNVCFSLIALCFAHLKIDVHDIASYLLESNLMAHHRESGALLQHHLSLPRFWSTQYVDLTHTCSASVYIAKTLLSLGRA